MDEDLERLTKNQLIAEVKQLRAAIPEHRDSTKHELCWHHPQLWGLLPEKVEPEVAVPAWPQFLRCCLRYRGRWICSYRMHCALLMNSTKRLPKGPLETAAGAYFIE